jgi:thiamine biosynthesis lipoprotein
MGTTLRVVLYARDTQEAAAAAAAACARVRALEAVFSDYDDESEARSLAARGPGVYPASPELVELTALALEVAQRTGGAFDVTVGPLTRLWRRALRQEEAPGAQDLAQARAAVGYGRLGADRARGTLSFAAPGMRLDFGGIAKGYAAEQALDALRARGCERALVALAGDVACGAPPPGEQGWLVALASPAGAPAVAVRVRDASVSTSGDLARGGDVAGTPVSHLIDPRTGQALAARPRIASAVAPDGARADALASALLLLDPAEGPALAAAFPGVELRLVELGPEGERAWSTPGFPELVSSPDRSSPSQGPP